MDLQETAQGDSDFGVRGMDRIIVLRSIGGAGTES
jgi:hypothetical protein